MNALAVPPMPKDSLYCEYVSTKLDRAVMPLARAAAALSGDVTVQEYLSDLVNREASKVLGRKPIKRKPAPPTSPGRPPKSAKP